MYTCMMSCHAINWVCLACCTIRRPLLVGKFINAHIPRVIHKYCVQYLQACQCRRTVPLDHMYTRMFVHDDDRVEPVS